ncbi:MAG TPA: TRAP transporter large permease [Beijerinckiaceae bacterium]|nr:TRAP transporter large permease [Beijerinckiaceae bacterium]
MIAAGYVGSLVVLFVLAVPVAFALAGTAIIVTLMERGLDFNPAFMVQRAVSGIDNFMLLSVPFFIYAGKVMNVGGITVRIYAFAKSLVGAVRGGLAQVNVLASIIFAGMTGTAVSEAAGLGTVVIKSMREEGYEEEFAVAVVAASSTIGPIIPPSVPLVIYALMANVSIGGILIAGIVPGLLMGLALMGWIALVAQRKKLPRGAPFSLAVVVAALKDGILPLMTPVILIGGILSGVFTPTEAAAIAALYATLLATVVYRAVGWRELFEIMRSTAVDTGVVMLIVSMAMIYGYLVTRAGLTLAMVEGIAGISRDPFVVGLMMVGFLLILGCFIEATAAIIILTPVLVPIMAASSIDPLHFGVVMVLTMMIGLLTPPFGMVLFVLNRISGVSLHRIVVAVTPFLVPLLAVTLLLLVFPGLVTTLPRLLM